MSKASSRWKKAATAVKIQNAAVRTLAASVGSETYFGTDLPSCVLEFVGIINNGKECGEALWKYIMKLALKALVNGKDGGGGGVGIGDLEEAVNLGEGWNFDR